MIDQNNLENELIENEELAGNEANIEETETEVEADVEADVEAETDVETDVETEAETEAETDVDIEDVLETEEEDVEEEIDDVEEPILIVKNEEISLENFDWSKYNNKNEVYSSDERSQLEAMYDKT